MLRIVNLCPHSIRIRPSQDNRPIPLPEDIVVPPSGTIARIETEKSGQVGALEGIPVFGKNTYLGTVGVPEYDPDQEVFYLVSALFSGRVGDRTDCLIPGTGPGDDPIRDEEGQIFAVTRLTMA